MRKQRLGSTCKAEHKPKRNQGDSSSFLGNSVSHRGILVTVYPVPSSWHRSYNRAQWWGGVWVTFAVFSFPFPSLL